MREAQKKLMLLVKSRADLDAKLPVTGDTPLHILARVFNTLSVRASGSKPAVDGLCGPREAEQFASCTQSRMQLLISFGASTISENCEAKTPLSLVSPKFQHLLMPAAGLESIPEVGTDSKPGFGAKSCMKILDERLMGADCLQ